MQNNTPIIAVDGPAASGKGTLCRRLAQYYSFDLLDTGLLYRATAAHCFHAQLDLDDEQAVSAFVGTLNDIDTNPPDLRAESMGSKASIVSRYPAVRAALLEYQRKFAFTPPSGVGAILDGRDIGTIICPDTPHKIFLTASAEKRAERRFLEMQGLGQEPGFENILSDVQHRDKQDESRTIAPLIPAEDAKIIDTTTLNADAVFNQVIEYLYGQELKVY